MSMHPLRPSRRLGGIEIDTTVRPGDPAYRRLLADAPTTGRCPVWITGYGTESLDPRWQAEPALADLETRDANDVLTDRWPGGCACPEDCMAPFHDGFPGILPRPRVEYADTIDAAAAVADTPYTGDLAVVPVTRPADIPAATGWTGMINSWDDAVGASAVLRSWEERFGAVLVRMDRGSLYLGVAAPPTTREDCLRVAAEHIAFCWDAFETYTGQMSTDTLRRYALRLRGANRWRFWWD
ncbi:DUF4253 domain-containing protein [Pseudonocardia nigra]|uniref:DUF4253 domain-containing protein n=1 Tax=Pseudonocardia nigra TaxID=1921578 RepID=UPI001C5F7D2D|nr:DUF4253 domain-containing protein [Pseudonocardia nigra]